MYMSFKKMTYICMCASLLYHEVSNSNKENIKDIVYMIYYDIWTSGANQGGLDCINLNK